MKKLLIILVIFIGIYNYAKAQTKEETITWLQEKLQKYYKFYGDKIVITVTECSITLSYNLLPETSSGNKKAYYNQYHIFPTDGLIFRLTTGFTTWSGFEDYIAMEIKENLKRIRVKDFSEVEFLKSNSQIQIVSGEENLSDRLNKAVTHLATFCPKTKETF